MLVHECRPEAAARPAGARSMSDGRRCATPIDAQVLTDYWLGALPAPQEEAIEQHLFECDDCGDRLRTQMALAESLRVLVQSGTLRVVVDDVALERAGVRGQRIREHVAAPADRIQCTVSADDDYLVARLGADLV